MPILKNDDKRFKLESQLSKMIVEMALEGKAAYARGIRNLQSTWRDVILGNDGFEQSFVAEVESIRFKSVEMQNPLSMKISAHLRSVAVRGADAVGLRQGVGWLSGLVEQVRGQQTEPARPTFNSDEGHEVSHVGGMEPGIDSEEQGNENEAPDSLDPQCITTDESGLRLTDEAFPEDIIVIQPGPRKRKRVDLNDVNLAKGAGKTPRARSSKRKRWGTFVKGKSASRTEDPEAKPRRKEMRYLHNSPTNNESLVRRPRCKQRTATDLTI